MEGIIGSPSLGRNNSRGRRCSSNVKKGGIRPEKNRMIRTIRDKTALDVKGARFLRASRGTSDPINSDRKPGGEGESWESWCTNAVEKEKKRTVESSISFSKNHVQRPSDINRKNYIARLEGVWKEKRAKGTLVSTARKGGDLVHEKNTVQEREKNYPRSHQQSQKERARIVKRR